MLWWWYVEKNSRKQIVLNQDLGMYRKIYNYMIMQKTKKKKMNCHHNLLSIIWCVEWIKQESCSKEKQDILLKIYQNAHAQRGWIKITKNNPGIFTFQFFMLQ